MSWAAKLVILLAIFVAGAAVGIKWQLGVQARADVLIEQVRALDAEKQRLAGDAAAINHAVALAAINQKLGSANAYISKLSGRECLGAGAVGMLNSIGGDAVPAAAIDPAGSPPAAAPGDGLRFATERDVAGAIAVCRAGYAGLSSQLNQILDIEEKRNPE